MTNEEVGKIIEVVKKRKQIVMAIKRIIDIIGRLEELSGKAEQEMNYYRELSEEDASCEVFADSHEKEYKAYCKAIEIVYQLAEEYNNDFCEWHKVKNGNAYKCYTHAEIYDSRVLDWCVCPYCGKKIKIVEQKGE